MATFDTVLRVAVSLLLAAKAAAVTRVHANAVFLHMDSVCVRYPALCS